MDIPDVILGQDLLIFLRAEHFSIGVHSLVVIICFVLTVIKTKTFMSYNIPAIFSVGAALSDVDDIYYSSLLILLWTFTAFENISISHWVSMIFLFANIADLTEKC